MFKEEIKESTIDSIIDLTVDHIQRVMFISVRFDKPAIKKKLKEIIKIKKGW